MAFVKIEKLPSNTSNLLSPVLLASCGVPYPALEGGGQWRRVSCKLNTIQASLSGGLD
ncbi:uncharacterized protein K460DRAFT_366582 [Cucurbitaria berberidis CBS 394.84]|uniref:Uncharacterized protein n=1 Tax=Cucurbitaria berberidis CBS 394.84 TaxID=1168544 RepID=A0A9P4GGL9_9PLEO|nr:uncharacterized protein K460DRAFT_366582 [Cucurbitaria berberidis CBS 394.84]KAF1845733.1 hypothetical protein K460DRAFT_366582 [Cucurbitaria berberidis CBS 394.84]